MRGRRRAIGAGRGRLGRTWHSSAGEGLYASLILRPPPPAPNPAALTMAAGLGVIEGLEALGLAGARLKWPNDVLHGSGKLAGLLVESRGLDPRAPAFVAGVGVNVRQRAFPAELEAERAVTSLALLGLESTVEDVSAAYMRSSTLERFAELGITWRGAGVPLRVGTQPKSALTLSFTRWRPAFASVG